MDNEAELLWGLLFSSFGLGFFVYGRKQSKIVPFVCGVALMVYPYFMPNTVVLVLNWFGVGCDSLFFPALSKGDKCMRPAIYSEISISFKKENFLSATNAL
jgi:hypothetical protein